MKGKSRVFKSDFNKMDATPGVPDEELPEFTDEMFDRGVWRIGDKVIRTPRRRGRPPGSGTKVSTTIRIERDVIAGFRAAGPGWQTRMNGVLREWLKRHPPPRAAAAEREHARREERR